MSQPLDSASVPPVQSAKMDGSATGVRGDKGFTIVEISVVVVIIAILAAIMVPTYLNYVDKAKLTLSVTSLSTLKKDLESYAIDHSGYPSRIDFGNFTDQNGVPVIDAARLEELLAHVYSFDSYSSSVSNSSYTLKARAMDSNHTPITVTNTAISY